MVAAGRPTLAFDVVATPQCYTASGSGTNGYVRMCVGDTITVRILSAECSGIGDTMAVHGAVELVVSVDACRDSGAVATAIAIDTGRVTFELTDPRYGSGSFYFVGPFTDSTRTLTVLMEDGYADGDYDDNVLEVTITGHYPHCQLFADSIMNIEEFRDSLIRELQATLADPNRTERGGHVYQNQVTGAKRWTRDGPKPGGTADACNIDLLDLPGPDEVAIASWHTHGYTDGEAFYGCSGAHSGTVQGYVNYQALGGGSLDDWPSTHNVPFDAYTIDPKRINLLRDFVTNPIAMRLNQDRYYWHGVGQCLTFTP